MGMIIKIPPEVRGILMRLKRAGYEAYAVGGCVRDSLLGDKPQDWDICTSALPDQTRACFDHCVLTGVKYGTVTVLRGRNSYEITTFRAEEGYSDSRHPEQVRFLDSLYEDLARRDLSINAMAADADGLVTDHFDGLHDLRHGLIRCVGEAEQRFTEDALRILRALRFAARFGFTIEPRTAHAIHALKDSLLKVSPERIRKELKGLLMGKAAVEILSEFSDVLAVILPELQPCMGFEQHNPHHIYNVYTHSLHTLAQVPSTEPLRLAALLHDIGKPACFTLDEAGIGHFYGHSEKSFELCDRLLHRLHYDNKTISHVCTLVQIHDLMLEPISEKRARRLLSKYGEPMLRDLISLRRADALATGTADPEELEHSLAQFSELLDRLLVQEGRFTMADLDINGNDLLSMGLPRGRQIGQLLHVLFDSVLEGICENQKEKLVEYARFLLSKKDFH
ncbi:MAG: HD domain-containing protein [Oscillospiraceae bacterium]|nr:HD domain-containing protein [Oscillospiraceae bacterium]